MENNFSNIQLLEAINRIASHLAKGFEAPKVFTSLLDDLLRLSNSVYGFIGEIDGKDNAASLTMRAVISMDTNCRHINSKTESYDFNRLFCGAIKRDEVVISDVQCNDNLPEACPPVMSLLSIPVFHGNDCVAVICMVNRTD